MLFTSNNIVIKRFTYDWLIRFAELYPIEIFDSNGFNYLYIEPGPYDPLESKYAAISPFFTTIISRYMPHISQTLDVVVKNGIIRTDYDSLPPHNKTIVYACETLEFSNINSGTISLLKNNRISFYCSKKLVVHNSFHDSNLKKFITADELKHVLKSCLFRDKFHGFAIFDKPTPFSEFWPLLVPYREIRIGLKNLIYGENVANVMSKCHVVPNKIEFRDLNISDKAILEMLGYFVSLPRCPTEISLTFLKPKPISFIDAVLEKFDSSGYRFKGSTIIETPFIRIQIAVINYDFTIFCLNIN